eukprot:TRINITY_DN24542_c0_g1_i2.p1 TRINITY_DN24542_c0_g1~~TRINITY_DN24542_c0_g1_i2.p1  ORF type:complete len:355 (+),score=69.68 TRINITY_DN24542_c0_g1_i2:132-1196(+)
MESKANKNSKEAKMPSFLTRIGAAYDSLWKAFIRPPRDLYTQEELGPVTFRINDEAFIRKDFQVTNIRGNRLECSLFGPLENWRVEERPCVVYLHGSSSSRVEALSVLRSLLPIGIIVCAFDFAGTGHSEGDYVSLGVNEPDDVEAVINHLRTSGKVTNIALWGRSMGAVAAIRYQLRDPCIFAVVADSPFASLTQLAEDFAQRQLGLSKSLISFFLKCLRRSIKKRLGFDVFENNPIDVVHECETPILFAVALGDDVTPKFHAETLFKRYGGDNKGLMYIDGDHNSRRATNFKAAVASFFVKRFKLHKDLSSGFPSRVHSIDQETPQFGAVASKRSTSTSNRETEDSNEESPI